jgi:condensin complex subunit 1
MPDIISRLSDPDAGIVESKFREILKYIIGLIEKDKHLESLVEKLCQRFRVTKTERQWRDLVKQKLSHFHIFQMSNSF